MEQDEELPREAETIDHHLRLIRRALLRGFEADRRRAGLTATQTLAMTILAQALDENQDGLTIRELHDRMGLAQSTVSSLVERLERKQLVRRVMDLQDRRCTRVVLMDAVKAYLEQTGPMTRLSPLISALQQATGEERRTIVEGLAILHRLVGSESGL